jgi:hypothetical protein
MGNQGISAGVEYIVTEKDGKRNIGIQAAGLALISQGADPKLLDDIGDQDPEDVMEKFFDSINKDPNQPKRNK